MGHRLSRTLLAAAGAIPMALAGTTLGHATTPNPQPFSPNFCPNGHAEWVDHTSGMETDYSGPTALQSAVASAKGSSGGTSGSGSGDTVIACPGTFKGPIMLKGDGSQDNVTVRSFNGPGNTKITGDGSTTAIVSLLGRGQTLGGPALGFTLTEPSGPTGNNNLTGIQVGIRGSQPNSNEDEQCLSSLMPSGCDASAPGAVTVNDEVIDNIITGFVPNGNSTYGGKITGIEADNTINTTLQQNLVQNLVGDHSNADQVQGIVVGTLNMSPQTGGSSFETGDSTDINTALFQNAFKQLLQGDNSTCGASTAITLNGFLLDAQVYNNLLSQVINDDDTSTCSVTGIYSNAYGSLENEQTGTLVPINANIDDNLIQQLASDTKNTAIELAPKPAGANPPQPMQPSGCTGNATAPPCNDNYPPSAYTVVDNQIQQVSTAVDVEALLGSNSYIRDNNFQNVVLGVVNGNMAGSADGDLDATNDFWGCPTGPTFTPGTPGGCAAIAGSGSGAVSYFPYLANHVEQAGDEAGDNAGQN